MSALLAGEARRLTRGMTLWVFLAAGVTAAVFLTGGLVLLGPEHMNPPMPGPDSPAGVRGFLSLLVLTAPIPIMLGARSTTREFDTRTVVPTLLTEPRRTRVVAAKLGVHLAAGTVYGVVLASGAVVGLLGGCALAGLTPGMHAGQITSLALRVGAAMALYTLVGVGIGSLVPRPQACLAVVVGWFYLGDSFVSALPGLGRVYPWLPGGAASALTGHSFVLEAISRTAGSAPVHLLPAWAGALLLVAYAVVMCGVSLVSTLRRDVT